MNKDIINYIKKGVVYSIIPARSGSKGIKDKNIKTVNGHPLIAYSIMAAKLAKNIDRVIVSTDSEKYAKIARQYGAETPFIRPKEISSDTSTDLEFFKHAIEWLFENEKVVPEYWVHLRVTCPLREARVIDEAIDKIKAYPNATSLISGCIPKGVLTPYKWFIKDGDYFKSIFFDDNDDANRPRQSYPVAYMRSVYVDIIKTETILRENKLFGKYIIPMITEETIDIDAYADYECVKKYVSEHKIDLYDQLERLKNEQII